METENELLSKLSAELFEIARRNRFNSTCSRDNSIETIFKMYLGFVFHGEGATVADCCRKFSELFCFISELQRSLRSRGEIVQELRVPREVGTHFPLGNPFHLCS